ncbi:hypothetical protein Mapa_000539 [Marchantia paleacea]|nr:hypothetical protein Mapa_000539 [Marchantia paleacea]
MEASLIFTARQNFMSEMKRSPIKRYSALFSVLLVFSFASTATRLRHVVLPSLRLCEGFLPNSRLCSDTARLLTGHRSENYWCDRSDNRTDICYIRGDVHLFPGIAGQKVSVHLFSNDDLTWHGEEQIQPYTRKYDPATMDTVDPVVLRSKYTEFFHPVESVCDIVHSVPLILFSAGGYTGNPYHDFQDVLVPMFITSKPYDGDVVFAITQARDWWLEKFSPLFRQMTKNEIIDMNQNKKVHCFPEATIGLRLHGELKVNPAHMPHNETMKDFQDMVHRAYGEIPSHELLAKAKTSSRCPNYSFRGGDCKLKLVILARNQTRVILNQAQVASFAQREGFDVQVLNPWGGTDLRTLYKVINGADVMMGVHGAALTHMVFMRPHSVLVQIVPLGTDWPSRTYYQEPAINSLHLQYLEYRITPDESTLSRTYSRDHPAVTDPEAVIAKNWETRKKIYMQGQDVRLSLPKLKLMLHEAKRLASMSLS